MAKMPPAPLTPPLTTQSRSQSRSRMSTKARRSPTADDDLLERSRGRENTAPNVNIGAPVEATDPDTKATNMDWKTLLTVSKIPPMTICLALMRIPAS